MAAALPLWFINGPNYFFCVVVAVSVVIVISNFSQFHICCVCISALHHAESLSQFEWWADRNTDIFESNNNFSVAQWRTYKIFASFRIQDILSVVWCFLLISNSFCSHSVWPVYLVDAHLFWNVSDCICAINVLFVVEHRIYHLMIISNTKILFL